MRTILRQVWLAILTLALCLPAPAAAQPTPSEAAQEGLEHLDQLREAAKQFAEQSGKIAGHTEHAELGSASAALVSILLNFDKWACSSAVLGLQLKRQRLANLAANADPADPALDKAVQDFGDLISRLQELCNQHVWELYGPAEHGGGEATTPEGPPPPPAPPPPPPMTPQERICYDRCHALYLQYLQAESEYDHARASAEAARQRATQARQRATDAAARARTAAQNAEDVQREYTAAQAAMTAATKQADRLRLAERLSHLHPDAARQAADQAQKAADQAAQDAQRAEANAASREAEASALYDAMMEIYQAWQHCAENCADQAKTYDHVTVDPHKLFPGMPTTPPRRPPFYRPPPVVPAPPEQPRTELRTSSRIITTPAALTGGTLVGAVYDDEGQPKENQRVAITEPDGSHKEVTTGRGGRFLMAVPAIVGTVALALPGSDARPKQLKVVDQVPPEAVRQVPEFLEVGKEITTATPYRQVSVETPDGLTTELPMATALGRDGRVGFSTFRVPYSVGAGPVKVHEVGMDGRESVTQAISYGYVRASIDQDKLRSGQNTDFFFDLDFGTGPMTVVATVTVEGPIVYDKAGTPQSLRVDAKGHARLSGKVHALQGSPTGIPFAITATFARSR